jgi:hypothetical protein
MTDKEKDKIKPKSIERHPDHESADDPGKCIDRKPH